jgi:hypothetical protein
MMFVARAFQHQLPASAMWGSSGAPLLQRSLRKVFLRERSADGWYGSSHVKSARDKVKRQFQSV